MTKWAGLFFLTIWITFVTSSQPPVIKPIGTYPLEAVERTIVVDSFAEVEPQILQANERLYIRKASCLDVHEPCALTLEAHTQTNFGISLQSTTQTLLCSATIENGFGNTIGRIENRQSTAFYGTVGSAPFAWQGLPDSRYIAGPGYWWDSSSKISTINPLAYTQAYYGDSHVGGTFKGFGYDLSVGATIFFQGGPWQCLAG